MPWTVKDVDKHIKSLTDKQKKVWVRVANDALARCIEAGGTDETCAPKAIRQANTVAQKVTEAMAKAKRKLAFLQEAEKNLEDWAYLIHHVVIDGKKELLHHCLLVDHLGNKYVIDHLVVKGKIYHVVQGLADNQDVYWSDEEAEADGQEVPCANRQLEESD